MKPVKDAEKVKKMFARGEPFYVDTKTGYKYSMTAICPLDGGYGSVARVDKAGQALSSVTFQCTNCFWNLQKFQVSPESPSIQKR